MQPVDIAFGLAFDIERVPTTASGFRPAQFDLGAAKDLFGDIRLEGFASLIRLGFAQNLTVVGGDEGRYKNDNPVNRADAIRLMLVKDHGLGENMISSFPSRSNTGGNVAIIKRLTEGADAASVCVVSNLYHLPRAALDLSAAGLQVPLYPAEAFILMENPSRKNELVERLGDESLAERYMEEAQGVADKLLGKYKPRTDISTDLPLPLPLPSKSPVR